MDGGYMHLKQVAHSCALVSKRLSLRRQQTNSVCGNVTFASALHYNMYEPLKFLHGDVGSMTTESFVASSVTGSRTKCRKTRGAAEEHMGRRLGRGKVCHVAPLVDLCRVGGNICMLGWANARFATRRLAAVDLGRGYDGIFGISLLLITYCTLWSSSGACCCHAMTLSLITESLFVTTNHSAYQLPSVIASSVRLCERLIVGSLVHFLSVYCDAAVREAIS